MYISEILDYDTSYADILFPFGLEDENVVKFMEWAFGKVVSNDRREWYRKWNRFHGKHLILTKIPESALDWSSLISLWRDFEAGYLK